LHLLYFLFILTVFEDAWDTSSEAPLRVKAKRQPDSRIPKENQIISAILTPDIRQKELSHVNVLLLLCSCKLVTNWNRFCDFNAGLQFLRKNNVLEASKNFFVNCR